MQALSESLTMNNGYVYLCIHYKGLKSLFQEPEVKTRKYNLLCNVANVYIIVKPIVLYAN